MLNKSVTSRNYCIEISVDRLLEILKEDIHDDNLYNKLDKINGISAIEYDGHFGPYIFLTIDSEDDTDEAWALIEEIIA